jgi:cytochrome c oxidase subunit 1
VEQPLVADEHAREHEVSGTHAESHVHDEAHEHAHHDAIHLPNPSYWPLIVSLGITVFFAGFLFDSETAHWAISAVGVFLTVVGIYAWAFEPAVGHGDTGHSAQHDVPSGAAGAIAD